MLTMGFLFIVTEFFRSLTQPRKASASANLEIMQTKTVATDKFLSPFAFDQQVVLLVDVAPYKAEAQQSKYPIDIYFRKHPIIGFVHP